MFVQLFYSKFGRQEVHVLYKSELARIVFGGEFVHAVLKVGWCESGESLKCPDEMRLIVVIMVNVFFQVLQFGAG
jgi:hypothetical protein